MEQASQRKFQLLCGFCKLLTNLQESYKAYKALLPVVKQADKLRQDSLGKDVEINSLKAELTATKIAQPNGGSSDNSTKYWKDKYETLLAACDG